MICQQLLPLQNARQTWLLSVVSITTSGPSRRHFCLSCCTGRQADRLASSPPLPSLPLPDPVSSPSSSQNTPVASYPADGKNRRLCNGSLRPVRSAPVACDIIACCPPRSLLTSPRWPCCFSRSQRGPASGPLHVLVLPSRMLTPQVCTWLAPPP